MKPEPSPPPSPAAAVDLVMEEDEEEEERESQLQALSSEREISPVVAQCGEEREEPEISFAMLTVEVVVDEVEPHHVQVAYSQVSSHHYHCICTV